MDQAYLNIFCPLIPGWRSGLDDFLEPVTTPKFTGLLTTLPHHNIIITGQNKVDQVGKHVDINFEVVIIISNHENACTKFCMCGQC